MSQPLISVIIPIYNAEEYLARCLDSVMDQTYQNMEMILVNDGSTDQSAALCDAYAARDDRIQVFHIPNSGVSSARNRGIEAAKGEYIIFVDSDDWLEPAHIQMLLPADDEDLVCCGYTQYAAGKAGDSISHPARVVPREMWMGDFWNFWVRNAIQTPWRSCYRAELIRAHGIRFDSKLSIAEDELFNLHYFRHCKNVRFTENCTYCYETGDHACAMRKYHSTRLRSAVALSEAVEGITGNVEYAVRWYHWHGAIRHLEKWKRMKKGREKRSVARKLHDCIRSPYFRACIPYVRRNGTLDERFKTYFMHSSIYALYKPLYNLLVLAAKGKSLLKGKSIIEDVL